METNSMPRRTLTDAERVNEWRSRLAERGGYSAAAAALITDFAIKAKSFETDSRGNLRPAGGIVVSMFIRLGTRLQEAAEVSEENVDYAVRELLRYFSEKPLGDSVEDWRTKFSSNGKQRDAIYSFFRFSGRRFSDFVGDEAFLFNVCDAAWPSRKEEAIGTGGTFAERLIIFAKAICRLATTSNDAVNILFSSFFHEAAQALPEWITKTEDGKLICSACGNDLTEDSHGRTICSNPLCDFNVAAGNFQMPESFKSAPPPHHHDAGAPAPAREDRRGDRKDRGDRRHDDDDGGEFPRNKGKKKGPKFRVNDDDDFEQPDAPAPVETASATPPPPGGFGNIGGAIGAALDGLKV